MKIGYIRGENHDSVERQRTLLESYGVDEWRQEALGGFLTGEMFDFLLEETRSGDEIVFTELEVIPISVSKFLSFVSECNEQEIRLTCINKPLDMVTILQLKKHQKYINGENAKRSFHGIKKGRVPGSLSKDEDLNAKAAAYMYTNVYAKGECTLEDILIKNGYGLKGKSKLYRHLKIKGVELLSKQNR